MSLQSVKRLLPTSAVTAGRPFVRAAVLGLHRTRQTVRTGRKRTQLVVKELFLRYRLSSWGPSVFGALARLRAPLAVRRRRQLAAALAARGDLVTMPRDRAFVHITPSEVRGLEDVIRSCRAIFESKAAQVRPDGQDTERKRGFLRNLMTNEDLAAHPELVEFALSNEVLGAVAKYLGTIPHLNRIDLLYSVPRAGEGLEASQLFHLDPEGLKQAKVFVNIYDVDDPQGPFTFIPADASRRLLQQIRVKREQAGAKLVGRYTDEEIAESGGAGDVIEIKGPAGSGVIVDTSRCLHCGSRVKAGAFRLCLYIQYCTSRELGNAFDVDRFRHDEIRYLAVKQSRLSIGGTVSAPHQMN